MKEFITDTHDCIEIKNKTYLLSEKLLKEFQSEIEEAFIGDNAKEDNNYQAFWKLDDGKLFLQDIKIIKDCYLQSVFPTDKHNIFANWFSGEIVIKKPSGILSRIFKEHKVTKKHHYTFKDGILKSFVSIDYLKKIDPEEEPF